jgi:hypothetical protein
MLRVSFDISFETNLMLSVSSETRLRIVPDIQAGGITIMFETLIKIERAYNRNSSRNF